MRTALVAQKAAGEAEQQRREAALDDDTAAELRRLQELVGKQAEQLKQQTSRNQAAEAAAAAEERVENARMEATAKDAIIADLHQQVCCLGTCSSMVAPLVCADSALPHYRPRARSSRLNARRLTCSGSKPSKLTQPTRGRSWSLRRVFRSLRSALKRVQCERRRQTWS